MSKILFESVYTYLSLLEETERSKIKGVEMLPSLLLSSYVDQTSKTSV